MTLVPAEPPIQWVKVKVKVKVQVKLSKHHVMKTYWGVEV
jgi:hypothetical protein